MNPIKTTSRLAAFLMAAALVSGTAQAQTTTTQTFNLGPQGSGTTIAPDAAGFIQWIAKGDLLPGSILRSVSADIRLDSSTGSSWASDLLIYADANPAAPTTDGVLQIGGNITVLGNVTQQVNWDSGEGEVGSGNVTINETKTAGVDWMFDVDLSDVELSIGNNFVEANWSGTVTVEYDLITPAAILSFGPGAIVGPLVDNEAEIVWTVPAGTDITALAPSFTLSSGTSDRDNGGPATYDFTSPVVYTITDGATVNTYTVTVEFGTALVWDLPGGGAWDFTSENWVEQISSQPTTFANDNEVIFDNTAGGQIVIDPDVSPLFTTVNAASGTYTFIGGPIATGSLVMDGGGTLQLLCAAEIPASGGATALSHTFDGGTTVNAGTLILGGLVNLISHPVVDPVGSGPVTLNGGTINLQRVSLSNPWSINGGTILMDNGWGATLSGPVTLNANSTLHSPFNLTISGDITGSGGFNKTGGSPLTLSGSNDFTGPVSVTAGILRANNANAMGSGNLTISGSGKVELNYSGAADIVGLTLGGVIQPSGTYGSTASDAEFKNDTFFAGIGMVNVTTLSPAKDMVSFSFGALGEATIEGTSITLEVPPGTDVTNLAPNYIVSPRASGSPVSGTSLDFTTPQVYTVTAEDSSTQDYTVTVIVTELPDIFTWVNAASGNWSTAANWMNDLESGSAPLGSGRPSYTLNFTTAGTYTANNNLSTTGFDLNQLNISANVTLAGNPLRLVADGETLPAINQNGGAGVIISNNLIFEDDLTFGGTGGGFFEITGQISGDGQLTKNGTGTLALAANNSFTGGTVINSGIMRVNHVDPANTSGLGTGPITLNGGTLFMWRCTLDNELTVNGGSLTSSNGFNQNFLNGPVTLNATLPINAQFQLTFNHTVSGSGGLTKSGTHNVIFSDTSTSTYTGPTTISEGTLRFDRPEAVSGSSDISISGTGRMNLNYSGTKAVASLTLGGVAQTAPGTYGSTNSDADFQNDTFFLGAGTITLGATGSDYETWLAGFVFPPGADTTPTGDGNGDGMSNFEKYAFGLDPTSGASINPIVSPLAPATGNFQYTRRGTSGLVYTVYTSTDLATWHTGGATEVAVTTESDVETVTINVTTPSQNGRLFVRVGASSPEP